MLARAGLLLNTLSCIRGCELVFDSFTVLERLLEVPQVGNSAAPDGLVRHWPVQALPSCSMSAWHLAQDSLPCTARSIRSQARCLTRHIQVASGGA